MLALDTTPETVRVNVLKVGGRFAANAEPSRQVKSPEGVETGWEPPDRSGESRAKAKAQSRPRTLCCMEAAAKAEVVRDQESPGSSPGGAMAGAIASAILFRTRPAAPSLWGHVERDRGFSSAAFLRYRVSLVHFLRHRTGSYCRRAACITGRRHLFLLTDGYTIPLPNGWSSIAKSGPDTSGHTDRRRLCGSFPFDSLSAGQAPDGDALSARAGVVG